ncbi:MAG TPA: hypothetical protein VF676_12930 [Flavobacterium sp.]|jgi:hypothetical protein
MRKLLFLVVVAGIVTRFTLQFLVPFFNVDEISLGNNILRKSYLELLYPLDTFQSSPPLYLWTQKFIISTFPFDFWVNIKMLSFLSSSAGLVLFYRLIRKQQPVLVLFALVIFAFNPFLLNNSLTVKQYTLDLLGVLILLNYYKTSFFRKFGFILFAVWGLFSNIGLFSCAGFLLYRFFIGTQVFNRSYITTFIKKYYLLFMAPIPYVIYFVWYMQQEGAAEMKTYMTGYWQDSFIPLNTGIFKYALYLIHGFWFNFYNGVELFGLFLLLVALLVVYLIIKRKAFLFKEEIGLMAAIFAVHVVLNVFQIYPLSGRLYVYLTPFFILTLIASLHYLSTLRQLTNYFSPAVVILTIVSLGCYSLYLPSKENDVHELYVKLEAMNYSDKPVYLSPRSFDCINIFNEFTMFKLTNGNALKFHTLDSELKKSDLLVSRVHHKIGPLEKTAKEEAVIQDLLDLGKLKLLGKVDGYNIYQIK